MSKQKKIKRWSLHTEVLFWVISSMVAAACLIAVTYAIAIGALSLAPLKSIGLATVGVAFIGLITCAAAQVRPWWPKTRTSKDIESTRKRVEAEWREMFKLAEKITAMMDKSVKSIPSARDMDDPKVRVIHGLSRQSVKNTKAALTMLQDGFPEAAICIWRTNFEIKTTAGYIEVKNLRVAERFMEWGRINHLSRTHPESPELQQLKQKWKARKLKPDDINGWTGNPPKDVIQRAEAIGLQWGMSAEGLNQIDLYKLANSFVHANWTASSNPMGQSDIDNTDGAAEGVGEVLYLIMETACETAFITAPDEAYRRLYEDICKLRGLARGSPERLRGTFMRMPTTEIIGIDSEGRVLVSTVKRREEWPWQARERSLREIQEIEAMLESATEKVKQSSPVTG